MDRDIAAERAADRADALAEAVRIDVAHVADLEADGVPVRLYRPEEDVPVLLYVHGGGWVFHDIETHDAFCRYLANATGWALLSVDYRRAPEAPYPAPLDDVATALAWLRAHGGEHGLDTTLIAGIGDSSGANMVAGLSVREAAALAYQVLVYPPTDAFADTASRRTEGGGAYEFVTADMDWYWDQYAPTDEAKRHPEVSPLVAADLTGQPPSLVITAEHDLLRDEGEAYAQRLVDAGVPTVAWRALGMTHGFWRRPWEFAESRSAVRLVASTLRDLAAAPDG
ncbi:alpha/beta hydrolase [Mumia zhuanghuii]|uniref:Alpha/beta hydrolase n=1 Tax=Mumia zhuanghuii TaxID=2585211 RepID=A0A5C4MHG5_9ACTN|nr:alpha/beta hydrolase [Mumia zhuanghuii]TNC42525.1 alpha/beta hydrolase [Mumia zhuanghuii]TNC42541.1 alpha/beta hydrolase [Mumia zhuanghuii]